MGLFNKGEREGENGGNFPRLASGSSLTRAFSLRRFFENFFENLENRWINRGLPKIRGIFF